MDLRKHTSDEPFVLRAAAAPKEERVPATRPPTSRPSQKLLSVVAVGIGLGLLGGYATYRLFHTPAPAGVPIQATQDIVEKVQKLILLPTDEAPTIATVSNLASLKGQLFFKNATLGDIVLMYARAQKAILYDPSQNKIIEVGPITVDSSQ